MISDKYPNTMRVSEWMKRIDELEKALDKALITYAPEHCGKCNIKKDCEYKNMQTFNIGLCVSERKEWCMKDE